MPQPPRASQILAAADLADGFIADILDAAPSLLVGKVADQDNKEIARAARRLAEFRRHLIDALARQPLGGADGGSDDGEEDGPEEDEEDDEALAPPAPARLRSRRA
ncbi:MAG TPA: hypothetical protein VMS38_10155 [Pseudorhodoferax sp.]|jgi:hypothetical protein|nr:hypothetical protein [Pseudorhodoferax sp.]